MRRRPGSVRVGTLLLAVAIFALPATSLVAAPKRPPLAGRDPVTGRYVALSQYRGKPVFVNAWGSWCYGCRTEAPVLAAFARTHRGKVAVIGLDTRDSKPGARQFVARYRIPYPSIFDPRGLIAGWWVRGVPSTLVFDARQRLVQRLEGTVTRTQLERALRRVRAGSAP
jgi:thiol-disulfide isomerase/thioredoxin